MIEIDEIISNTEYCADVYERMNNAIHPALQVSDYKRHAEDHRQLAGWLKDYKRLKEQEPCEDAINREEVLKLQYRIDDSSTLSTRDVVNIEDIEDLPSVTPKEKTGYWINKEVRGKIEPYCSVCGDSVDTIYHYNYCPNCGAKMVEPQESEDV